MRSGNKYLWLCKRDIEANGVFFRANDIYYEKDGIVMDDNNKDVEVGGIYNGKVSYDDDHDLNTSFDSKDVFRYLPIGEAILFQHQYEFEIWFSIGVITKRTENQNKTLMGRYNYGVVMSNGMTNVVNSASIFNTIEPELVEEYRDQEYLKAYLDKKSENGYPIMVADVIIGAEKQIQIMKEIKEVKVASFFGGGYDDRTTQDYADAVVIGEMLVAFGYGIVKNGGYTGLMEASSKGVIDAGGEAQGYPVAAFGKKRGNEYLSKTHVVVDIYDRLRKLIEGTELFVIGRGGIGTLAEVLMVFDMMRKLPESKRPKVILYGTTWMNLMTLLDHEFGGDASFYEITETIEDFAKVMKSYEA